VAGLGQRKGGEDMTSLNKDRDLWIADPSEDQAQAYAASCCLNIQIRSSER